MVTRGAPSALFERRGTDLVARYGGEEFCIVFAETDAADAHHTCEALRAAGVISEDEARPLGAFAGLKAKMEGR